MSLVPSPSKSPTPAMAHGLPTVRSDAAELESVSPPRKRAPFICHDPVPPLEALRHRISARLSLLKSGPRNMNWCLASPLVVATATRRLLLPVNDLTRPGSEPRSTCVQFFCGSKSCRTSTHL